MSNYVEPTTGKVDLVTMPVVGSRPYGIKQADDGTIWVGANGANRLYSIHPESLEVTEHVVPHADSHVRRLDITPGSCGTCG